MPGKFFFFFSERENECWKKKKEKKTHTFFPFPPPRRSKKTLPPKNNNNNNNSTKAYVDMFAKSLDLECAKWNVHVQNQAPAYVATKMSKIRKPTLDAPSPAKWVAAAVRAIGHEPTSCPYWYHGAMWAAVTDTPLAVTNAYLLKFHEWLRARYYKKVEREAAGKGKKAK